MTAKPDLFLLATDFENVGFMFTALAESACLAIEADHLPDHFSTGLHELFRVALSRLDDATTQLYEVRKVEKADKMPAQHRKVKAAPAAIRDQFIKGAHNEGYSPADISMALGLPQGAVLRAIARLTGEAEERRKAS